MPTMLSESAGSRPQESEAHGRETDKIERFPDLTPSHVCYQLHLSAVCRRIRT